MKRKTKIHPTAVVEENVTIGDGAAVWHWCQIRRGAKIGREVSLGKSVFIDEDVQIGDFSRIQNGVNVYQGVKVAEWVFIGPEVVFTNDTYPRAASTSWKPEETILSLGASVGAGAVIKCGVVLGTCALVGAGAIVTKDVEAFSLCVGFPAKKVASICACGHSRRRGKSLKNAIMACCRRNLSGRFITRLEKELRCL